MLCWKSWEALCKPKSLGGMCFRDFEGFNFALHAKQCWHILLSPFSMVAKCLQAKYFPSGNFLGDLLAHKPYFLWISLLEVRNLLSLGLRYWIGNGLSITTRHSKWIASLKGFLLLHISFPEVQKERWLISLIFFQYCWREDKICYLFLHHQAEVIVQIRLNPSWLGDKIIWSHASNEIYTIKSGYKFGMNFIQGRTPTESPSKFSSRH